MWPDACRVLCRCCAGKSLGNSPNSGSQSAGEARFRMPITHREEFGQPSTLSGRGGRGGGHCREEDQALRLSAGTRRHSNSHTWAATHSPNNSQLPWCPKMASCPAFHSVPTEPSGPERHGGLKWRRDHTAWWAVWALALGEKGNILGLLSGL